MVRRTFPAVHRHVPADRNDSERSKSQTLVDTRVGYQIAGTLKLRLDVFNLFDTKSSDITYFYESRLQSEPDEGAADRHFNLNERRSYRVSLFYQF